MPCRPAAVLTFLTASCNYFEVSARLRRVDTLGTSDAVSIDGDDTLTIHGRPVVTVGMFDSGTNLMADMLKLNFGEDAQPYGSLDFWKHTPPSETGPYAGQLESIAKFVALQSGVVVAMVRNPFAQIAGWKKAPYQLSECLSRAELDAPCQLEKLVVHRAPDGTLEAEKHQFSPHGPVGVWNDVTSGYVNLAKKHRNVLLVRYEDLVLEPSATLARVSKQLGVALPTPIRVMEQPAKSHGRALGHSDALVKIQQRLYLKQSSWLQQHRADFCHWLRLDLDDLIPSTSNMSHYAADCSFRSAASPP